MGSVYNFYDEAIDFLKDVEGLSLKPYTDITGHLSIGYGRNLDAKGINEREAIIMLQNDLEDVVHDLLGVFPDLFDYPKEIQIVLISMMFNLGLSGFLTFKKFIQSIKDKDYEQAKFELIDSKRAFQIPNRVKKEVALINRYLERKK